MNQEPENYSLGRLARRSQFVENLRHYRDLLVRRWWILAAGLALGVAVEVAISRYQAPAYISVGQMIVNVKLAIPQGSVFTEELSNFLGTQAALMQSEVVLNRAYALVRGNVTNGIPQCPLLKVSISPRTTIFNLQAIGPEPMITQSFLQACMEEYRNLKREMRKDASFSTVKDLSTELATLENELRVSEQHIAEFQGTNSMVWMEEHGNTLGNYLAGLNQRLEALKSEHDLLQTLTLDQNVQRQDSMSGAAADAPATDFGVVTNGLVNNNTLGSDYLKAKQQLLLMKAEQQDMGQFLRPKHPKMVAMMEEISRRERLLEIYRQQNAEQLEGRKASVALQIQSLQKDIKTWDAKLVEVSRKAAEYQRLKSNSLRLQALQQQLLAAVQTVDASKEVGAESVSIMEPASPALLDVRKSRNNLIFAAAGCLAGILAILILVERMDDRVNSLSELQEVFEDPVLAQVPREHLDRGRPKLIHAADERHAFVESYRNLRSSLLYIDDSGKPPKTVLLTSTIPNEGKSVTASNLAVALAVAGARVLVVDADLRKGVLHSRFGIEEASGLSEVLGEGSRWQDLVRPTDIPNLVLLPRGRPTPASGELFLRPAARQFLKEASDRYDYVILDTPPVMAADDVTTLAPHCDGVVFVLRAEHTSARVARAALDLLCQRKCRVLGLVFNAVRPGSSEYYLYKYKQYYASYPARNIREPAAKPETSSLST